MNKSPSITELASSVVDNGRRGAPKPGCDCVQCFGYCLVDKDEAVRQALALGAYSSYESSLMRNSSAVRGNNTLDFSDAPIT